MALQCSPEDNDGFANYAIYYHDSTLAEPLGIDLRQSSGGHDREVPGVPKAPVGFFIARTPSDLRWAFLCGVSGAVDLDLSTAHMQFVACR